MATKTEANRLRSRISKLERSYARQNREVQQSKRNWTRSYHAFLRATKTYIALKNVNTKTAATLRARIDGWDQRSIELTRVRDSRRAARDTNEQKLIALRFQVAQIRESIITQRERHDVIVDTVFRLNTHVVAALATRNDYLHDQVYSYLVDDKGNTRSQVTFTSADGLRRVVAMVNSIQLVDSTIVGQAFELIDAFFERVGAVTVTPELEPLYDLTRRLLTEKRSFKVGETFTRFMALKLTKKDFRELVEAQELLKQAVRPEKTTSYVRLYTREDRKSNWVAEKLT